MFFFGVLKIGKVKEEFIEGGWYVSFLGGRVLSNVLCFLEVRDFGFDSVWFFLLSLG